MVNKICMHTLVYNHEDGIDFMSVAWFKHDVMGNKKTVAIRQWKYSIKWMYVGQLEKPARQQLRASQYSYKIK